ncbi:MAG: hypothetical protein ACREUU_01750 [Gammaproteobacteria bacterium]
MKATIIEALICRSDHCVEDNHEARVDEETLESEQVMAEFPDRPLGPARMT